jgi:ubiquinone/menaquinone biosynthesis C-methylase UbiE
MSDSDLQAYKKTWQQEDPLYVLNHRLHDGVPIKDLEARGDDRINKLFHLYGADAAPQAGNKVLELGSGVGWIMQSLLKRFPEVTVTGLDVSENCINKARKRWQDPRANFVLYDGTTIPIADESYDRIYSVACIQHIEKHCAFLIFNELYRILKTDGWASLHFLSYKHIKTVGLDYKQQCKTHLGLDEKRHWLFFYTKEELEILFGDVIGAKNLTVTEEGSKLFLRFQKS